MDLCSKVVPVSYDYIDMVQWTTGDAQRRATLRPGGRFGTSRGAKSLNPMEIHGVFLGTYRTFEDGQPKLIPQV